MVFWRDSARTSLGGIDEATLVEVEGTIVGPETVTSPMGGRRGVVLVYRFYSFKDDASEAQPLVMGRLGDAVLVQVGEERVLVPIEPELELSPTGVWDPQVLSNHLPDIFTNEHPVLGQCFRDDLRYDEKVLHEGARVRLRATLEPMPRKVGSAYRGGREARWDFVAQPGGHIEELTASS